MELGQSDGVSGGTGALTHFLWTAFDTSVPITAFAQRAAFV